LIPYELDGGGRFVLKRKEFIPAYIKTYEEGRLREKAAQALENLHCCIGCPRRCRADRTQNRKSVCNGGRNARVSSAFPHFGEEDCLRGRKGSGTIFFASCNLRCVFCQNHEISQQRFGSSVTAEELAGMMLSLQGTGCHNINLVTPEHVAAQIIEALVIAVGKGLHIPLVYNTSAYDGLTSLELMDGVVDIYMPDFKLWDPHLSLRYLAAKDYPAVARHTIGIMYQQVGDLHVDEGGLAVRGLLVRHLVMPGLAADTRHIMRYLAANISPDVYINIMDQYQPHWKVLTEGEFASLNRPITETEYRQAVVSAKEAGLWRFDKRWQWYAI
jgi:putative pyruvate formate lyase activating enzyme